MLEFKVNNNGVLKFSQNEQNGDVTVCCNDEEPTVVTPPGEMVMLYNYYNFVKKNNIKCEFVNYNGINKRDDF